MTITPGVRQLMREVAASRVVTDEVSQVFDVTHRKTRCPRISDMLIRDMAIRNERRTNGALVLVMSPGP
jgi:hypothetical protein